MQIQRWHEEPIDQLNPSIGRQMIHTETMTLARIILGKGAVVPRHEHENEQIATVLAGPASLHGRRRGAGGRRRREHPAAGERPARGRGARGLDRARRLLAGARGLAARRGRLPSGLKSRRYNPAHADVAQLARASACHAEGRGFESHHPLYESPAQAGFLLDRGRRWAQFWNRSGTTQRPSESGVSSHTSSSATRPCSSCRSAVPAGACSGRRRQACISASSAATLAAVSLPQTSVGGAFTTRSGRGRSGRTHSPPSASSFARTMSAQSSSHQAHDNPSASS